MHIFYNNSSKINFDEWIQWNEIEVTTQHIIAVFSDSQNTEVCMVCMCRFVLLINNVKYMKCEDGGSR